MHLSIIQEVTREVLTNTPYKPFLCLPLSALLYSVLRDRYKIQANLVTGDLTFYGQYIFKQDFTLLSGDHSLFKTWAGHAWVEVEEYIIDLSFFRSLYSDQFDMPEKDRLISIFGPSRGAVIIPGPDFKGTGLYYWRKEILRDATVNAILKGARELM